MPETEMFNSIKSEGLRTPKYAQMESTFATTKIMATHESSFFNVLHKKFQLMEESHTFAHLLYEESVIITGSPNFKSQVKISKPKMCNKSECALSPKKW
jgi:hypothetical protein